MKIICPNYVNTAFELFKKSGFEAYAVGGCVRDSILGKTPNDWDMTTSALPYEIFSVFNSYHVLPTGISHGTVTVIIDGHHLEITTMRIDGEYSDNRHPQNVKFTNKIEKDLSRRDFTINAIAYNPECGIIDPFGGINDIKNKIIRCVGNAELRFNEDALRIMRAIRFASVLDFIIDDDTSASVLKCKELLDNIANERIHVELVKLLCGQNVERILTDYKQVIFQIIPELSILDGFEQRTDYHIYDIWTHTVKVVANINNTSVLRVAALLHDVGKPERYTVDTNGTGHFKGHPAVSEEKSEIILSRLRFSNAEKERICKIIALHDMRPNGTKKQIMHWCSKYSVQTIKDTLTLMKADAYGQNPKYFEAHTELYNSAESFIDEIENENSCLNISDLRISGKDMIEIGFVGNNIGTALQRILDKVLDGEINNTYDELEAAAKELL